MELTGPQAAKLFEENVKDLNRSRDRIDNYARVHDPIVDLCLNSRKLSASRREIQFTFRRFGPNFRSASHMANRNSKPANGKSDMADGFRISGGPVIRLAEDEQSGSVHAFGDVVELPRVHGAPM